MIVIDEDRQRSAVLPSAVQRVGTVAHPIPAVPFHEKYRFVKPIGLGGEANCDRYDSLNMPSGTAVAVKTVVRPNPCTNYLHEADVLALVPKHPQLVELLEVFQGAGEQLRIVMPLYCGGDITHFVNRFATFGVKIPECFVWHVFVQLMEGLHHLHTNHVLPLLHRDLKPENVVVDLTSVDTLFDNIKLIDFGMATHVMEPHEHRGGTPKYQPPEAPIASTAADVYASGGIIHYLLTGKAPKPDCPSDLPHDDDRHAWYAKASQLVERLVHNDHTHFFADKQPLSHAHASKATYEHFTPLPVKKYSPLLEYWVLRALDQNAESRATTSELVNRMSEDAARQIDFYSKWVPLSKKRPLCGFAYPEPPAYWKPE